MTADVEETESVEKDSTTAATFANVLPPEIEAIFVFLSGNDKIVFKSQQIDDPELLRSEKTQIAREIYEKNRQIFLMRFGIFLEEQHLSTFARLAISSDANAAPLRVDEHCEEMQLLLVDYRNKLHTRKRDVKNRRYAAMQRLIKQGEYFSEQEMMKRAPELYQELVGQYLSSAEKKQRDGYDVRNTTFSGILMHTMEQREMDNMLKQADKQNERQNHLEQHIMAEEEEVESDNSDDEVTSTKKAKAPCVISINGDTNDDDIVPASFRQQWGNFDNEQQACSTSRAISTAQLKRKSPLKPINVEQRQSQAEKFITAGERDLLRQEFIGIMHERFLAGNDDDFDYAQVDDDSQLDDLQQLNQDKEDAYFEASDNEDISEELNTGQTAQEHIIRRMEEYSDESEDELDVYMNHLSKHHSLQN